MDACGGAVWSAATLSACACHALLSGSTPIRIHRPTDAWSFHAGDHRLESGWGTSRVVRIYGFSRRGRGASRPHTGSYGAAMAAVARARVGSAGDARRRPAGLSLAHRKRSRPSVISCIERASPDGQAVPVRRGDEDDPRRGALRGASQPSSCIRFYPRTRDRSSGASPDSGRAERWPVHLRGASFGHGAAARSATCRLARSDREPAIELPCAGSNPKQRTHRAPGS